MTNTYPALDRLSRNGLPVHDIPVYIGYKEIANKWGITDSAVRNYVQDNIRFGEWRYLPIPDVFLVRDDRSVLPGWLEATIDNFQRPVELYGPGNHTRGAERKGYQEGAFSMAYRTLGVANADKIRESARTGVSVAKLAVRWGLKEKEVTRILAGQAWVEGTGKARGRMDTTAMADLGVEKADEIRLLHAAGESVDGIAEQYDLSTWEVDDVLSGARWVRGSQVLAGS